MRVACAMVHCLACHHSVTHPGFAIPNRLCCFCWYGGSLFLRMRRWRSFIILIKLSTILSSRRIFNINITHHSLKTSPPTRNLCITPPAFDIRQLVVGVKNCSYVRNEFEAKASILTQTNEVDVRVAGLLVVLLNVLKALLNGVSN